ncbi:MAG: TonB-dependent receptor [Acidobacteriaceae bacterium]|nr:TonB-dependent receptor [Acidobacteriaceae bacterium]MBV9779458.1 TonB-dependent receptor [Acidobacteriaceae bacterium]
MTRIHSLPFSFFVAAILSVSPLWGQAETSLRGVITDPSGASVPIAQVTLANPATGLERHSSSNAKGEYEMLQLPPGTYRLTVEASGFKKYEVTDLQLQVNSPATVNAALQVGGTTETVEVTGEAALLNTVDASIGAVMTENQVKELPIEGRDVAALYSLQPGVIYLGNNPNINPDQDTRSGAVNGARSDQSNILLDGVDSNDQTRGYAFTSVLRMTPDSIQEFRVATTNYDAESGRSSGAEISIVTKSGTNSFHGSAYEYNRNTATEANDYFLKLSQLQHGEPNKPLEFIRNVFGASLGGPIKKDRAFFFLNWESRRDAQQESILRVVPSLTLREGIMQYQNVDGGVTTLSPQQLAAMDPLGIGPNPVMLKFFQSYPLPNDLGAGDGLNYSGYRFAAPIHNSFNTYIARFDYMLTQDGKHTLFWRGNLMDDQQNGVPYLPGQSPLKTNVDHSKGFVAGETAILTPSMVNNFRYGFTRQSVGMEGNSQQPWILFRGLNDSTTNPETINNFYYTNAFQAPVHNFVDDLSWKKGTHSFSFGTNVRFIRSPSFNLTNSFSSGITNASWLSAAAIANTGTYMDPAVYGYPAVASTFDNAYDYPLIALLGAVTQGNAVYNYTKTGAPLAQGTPIKRDFAVDQYEFYAQDSWRLKPNFTVTYGLRYSLESPPWEVNGLEVAPTINMTQFFNIRALHGADGIPSNQDPKISYDLAGNGKPGFYPWQTKNFAPRLGIAWVPGGGPLGLGRLLGKDKTSIRAGFGIVYDNIGEGLIHTFDTSGGAYGLSTTITNPSATLTLVDAPRLTSLNAIPSSVLEPAPAGGFPQTPPPSVGQIVWGVDNGLKIPYAYQLDFSISRELPHNMIFEASYVGHLAHRLLTQEDLDMPLDLVDTASGVDYFRAATRFSQLAEAGTPVSAITPSLVGPTAAYWGDIFPNLPALGGFPGLTPLQAAYSIMSTYLHNETTGLFVLDYPGVRCPNGCSKFGPNAFYNPQFASLYGWRTIGNSSYNAAQFTLRKRFSQGVQFDLYYTFSKSLDLTSDAERIQPWGGLTSSQIINSWDYKALRAVSDFDTTHQITANFVAELPFGRNRLIARNANGWLDAIIGGWQLTGIYRWTSGFPVSVSNGATWPTNWQLSGEAMPVGTLPQTGTFKNGDGIVNIFPEPQGALSDFRHDYPGESGARNNLRGDGIFNIDLGLDKRWKMPWKETHSLQFRWEVFNVTNSVRFDVQSLSLALDQQRSFGNYTQELSTPRVMQFALRYEF